VEDLYPVLTVGGTLYIVPEPARMDIGLLPQQPLDLDNPQLGIRIISSTCEKLSYKYMWGQNILLGVFHAK